MALKTSALNSVRERVTLTLPYAPEDPLNIVYNPQGYTADVETMVNELKHSEKAAEAVIELLLTMLLEWDLEDDNGVVAVTPEGLHPLPTKFLGDVMSGIADEIQKVVDAGNSSTGGSLLTAS